MSDLEMATARVAELERENKELRALVEHYGVARRTIEAVWLSLPACPTVRSLQDPAFRVA
jgi:hypothetical protein